MLIFTPVQFNQRPRRSYHNTQPAFYGFNDFGYDDYVSLRQIELARQQRQAELERHRLILHLQEVERRRQAQIQAELERQAARRHYIARLNGLDNLYDIALEDETPSRFPFARRGGSRCGPRGYRSHQPRYTDEDVLASILGLTPPSAEPTQEGPPQEKKVRFAPSQEPAKATPISEVDQFEKFLTSLFGGQPQAHREEAKADATKQDAGVEQLQNFFEAILGGVAQPSKDEVAPQKEEAKTPRQQEKQPEVAPTSSKSSELEEFVTALLSSPSLFPSKEELTRKEASEKPACGRVPRNPRPNRFYRWYAREVSRPECEWRRRNAMKTSPAPVPVEVKEATPASEKAKPVTPPTEVKPADPELAHRASLATLSSIKSSLSSLTPPHSPPASTSSLPKQETKAYEEALMKVLERLDGVESNGDDEVREVRRNLVRAVEGELGRIDLERGVTPTAAPESDETYPAAPVDYKQKEAAVEQEVIPTLVDDAQKDAPVTAAVAEDAVQPTVTDTEGTPSAIIPEATAEENEEVPAPALTNLDNDELKAVDEVAPMSKANDTQFDPEHPLTAVPVSTNENTEVDPKSGAGAESNSPVVELDASTLARPPNPEPAEEEDADSDVRSLSSESSFTPSEFEQHKGLPHYHSMPDIAAAADNMKEGSRSLPNLASPEAATRSSESEEESEGLDDDTVLLSDGSDGNSEGSGEKFEMIA